MNNFRKIIEAGNKISLGTLTREDRTITDPGEDTVNYLLSRHFLMGNPLNLQYTQVRQLGRKT